MTTIISPNNDGPCIMRMIVGASGATYEVREWPLQVARHRSVFENRAPVRVQTRGARGRFGKAVWA